MGKGTHIKLFVMMLLEFFIWGAWLPLIFGYLPSLGFTGLQQSLILNAFPIAAIVGMFFSNQFADRNFAAEKFLAFSHLVGGLAILSLAFIHASPEALEFMKAAELLWKTKEIPLPTWNPHAPFWPFFGLMLVHCLLYVPTISVTNSIAFTNMKDAQKEFGIVRLGGTIGWILAAWPFTFILVDWAKVKAANPEGLVAWLGAVLGSPLEGDVMVAGTRWTYVVAGAASLLLAAFSLTLPHTPPKPAAPGEGGATWVHAFKLLAVPYILILWLVTFIDAFVHNCFFFWAGTFLRTETAKGGVGIPGNWTMPIMSIGQIAEILTMFVLGWTLKNLGWRMTMVFGILGHAARFAVFAFLPQYPWLIVFVNVVHGVCYAFFFATVYIFVDEFLPKDMRTSAQGLFNFMILGVGALVANFACPQINAKFTDAIAGTTNFKSIFLIPCGAAVVATVALALFFHPPKNSANAPASPALPH